MARAPTATRCRDRAGAAAPGTEEDVIGTLTRLAPARGVIPATLVAVAAAILVMVVGGAPVPAAAAGPGLVFPAPAGTQWRVADGYNTATHSMADGGDPYALDIVRTDAPTAGTPVLAPIDGTIAFVESSGSRCIGIRDANHDTVMMCHLDPLATMRRGMAVTRGTQLATVAKAGDAANNGLAHIHFAVSQPPAGRTWGMGVTVPFVGQYAIEGTDLPATTAPDAYTGVTFTSTNVVNHAPTVDAGPDVAVRPGAPATLTARATDRDGDPLTYSWSQSSGPGVALSADGATATFTAPSTEGARLVFTVAAVDPGGLFGYDTVAVTVSASAPATSGQAGVTAGGVVLSGSLPASGGFGTLLFSGGTTDQLVAAAACPSGAGRFWVVDGGGFVPYFPGAATFVNARWNALFANGLPARTIVIGTCG